MGASVHSMRASFDDDDFDIVLLHAPESDSAFALLYRRHAAAVLRCVESRRDGG